MPWDRARCRGCLSSGPRTALPGGSPCPGGAIFSLRGGKGSGRCGAGAGVPGGVSGISPDSGITPLDLRERPAGSRSP